MNTLASLKGRISLAVAATVISLAGTVAMAAPADAAVSCNKPQLRRGSTGQCVQLLQEMLNHLYHNSYPVMYTGQLTTDGIFGYHTDQTVRNLQITEHIDVDGIVGPITWSHVCFPNNAKVSDPYGYGILQRQANCF
jgi:murein L,D-transpeptidase YcbB/YkuD